MAGLLILAAACGGEARDPTGLQEGPTGPPGIGGGGGSGGGGAPGPLVGQWVNSYVVILDGDVQRTDTTWEFDTRDRCSQTIEVFSVLEDRRRFNFRGCAYQVNTNRLAVLFDDAQDTVSFEFRFPNFTDDRVIIDRFEFRRLF